MRDDLRRARLVWPTLVVLPALALLIGLGSWQWERRVWKQDLLSRLAERTAAEPLAHERALSLRCQDQHLVGVARACDYTRVRLRGRFDHAGERHIFIAVARQPGGIGGTGYWVFTPFAIEGTDRTIYVNRGFVPEASKSDGSRSAGQVAGPVEILAQVRSAERRGTFSNDSDPARNIYFVRDPIELAGGVRSSLAVEKVESHTLGHHSLYLDMIGPVPPGGLPLPLVDRLQIPNRHLEYALTWWALAATLVGVYAVFAAGRLRAARAPAPRG